MPRIQLDQVSLAYEECGQGEPLLFLHEFAGSSKAWAEQVQDFSVDHRVIVYNCRGYPPSSVPADPDEYSQERAVSDLYGLLEVLGIGRSHLVGLSMGGSTALNFAIRYPDKVQSLVLASTGSGSTDKPTFVAQFGVIADSIEHEGSVKFADEYLRGPTRIQLLRKRPREWQRLRDELSRMPASALASTIRGIMLKRPSVYELEADLRRLSIPALVLVGDEDTPVLLPANFLVGTLPLASLKTFKGTGHTLNLEEPMLFNSALREFLTGAVYE